VQNTNKNIVPPSEIERQREYTELVRTVLSSRFADVPKAFVHTYGCQGNVADGERLKGMLRDMGFAFTDSPDNADFVLYNTCAIREHAEDRVFGNVGKLKNIKSARRHMKIALCGCMTQQERVAELIRTSYPFVDIVFGTHVTHRLPEFVYRSYGTGKRVFETGESGGVIAEGVPLSRDSGFRAWVPVMYGCDNFCSYCVVPYVRGRERSREPGVILNEIRQAVGEGYKEINLLGQNVNSYNGGMNFPALLREINSIDGDFTIRFMTSHPKDCTRELLDTMADCEKAAKHLHLPVQSGNNRVLGEMNRRYTREQYLELVSYAREKMPGLSITSDIIVGFPGETDTEFRDTLSLVEAARFTSLFMFIFSPREGTAAAKMPDETPHAEKVARFQELERVQHEIALELAAGMAGKRLRVLCDSFGDGDIVTAKTEGNMAVRFKGTPDMPGTFQEVVIEPGDSWKLTAALDGCDK